MFLLFRHRAALVLYLTFFADVAFFLDVPDVLFV